MSTFKHKDFGSLTYFLGLKISRTNAGIHIHQRKYAEDLLSITQLINSKITDTPLELNVKICKEECIPLPASHGLKNWLSQLGLDSEVMSNIK